MDKTPVPSQRRSFLSAIKGAAAPLAALTLGSAAVARAQSKAAAPWMPARHDKDNWLDEVSVKHRLVFDTITPDGFGEALAFAGNYARVNETDYGLKASDLAVVIVARHRSTPFAYNDAIWAKYGAIMTGLTEFQDPKTNQPPKLNVFASDAYGPQLPNRGTTVDAVTKQGIRFAVCGLATGFISGIIAKAVGAEAEKINAELVANLVPNSRIVPAGIVAVSRAQERGYTLVRA